MILQRPNFFVVTGGSGAGKSSLISALKARGHLCVEEAGRRIVQEQMRLGGDATPWQDMRGFVDMLFERSVEQFEQVTERRRPVFFDRGILEPVGAFRKLGKPIPKHIRTAVRRYRYASRAFVAPPWRDIYRTDPERPYSWQDAVSDHDGNVEIYSNAGYELVELPCASVEERVAFVLDHVEGAV